VFARGVGGVSKLNNAFVLFRPFLFFDPCLHKLGTRGKNIIGWSGVWCLLCRGRWIAGREPVIIVRSGLFAWSWRIIIGSDLFAWRWRITIGSRFHAGRRRLGFGFVGDGLIAWNWRIIIGGGLFA